MAVVETSNSLNRISPILEDCTENLEESEVKVTESNTPAAGTELHQAELFLASIGLQPSSSKEEPKDTMSEPRSLDPSAQLLPPGWRKIYVKRMGGRSAGKYDAYIFSPDGKKHRSKTELLSYLTKIGIADQYNIDNFDFSVRCVSVEESVDSLNSGSSVGVSSKEKASNVSQGRPRKHKTEDSEKTTRIKKVKRSRLETSDDVDVSNFSETKESKKVKKLHVSSLKKSNKQEKVSVSPYRKTSPAKRLKHASSFKLPRKLKIKLNFSPRIRKEFANDSTADFTANVLLDSDMNGKSSESNKEERLNSNLNCSSEDTTKMRLLDSSVDNVTCESPELFSDNEESLFCYDHLRPGDEKSEDLERVESDGNVNGCTGRVLSTEHNSDSEIASNRNSLSADKNIPSAVEECNNNTSVCLDTGRDSEMLRSKVKTEDNPLPSKVDGNKLFAVNHFTKMKLKKPRVNSGLKHFVEEWVPPQSPYNLIEESLDGNPWKVLVASILIDSQEGCLTESVLSRRTVRQFFKLCPNPEILQSLSTKKICRILKQDAVKTVHTIKKFSGEYLAKNWRDPTALHGITGYGRDSYRIFCINEWKQVAPEHPKLRMYHNWLWQNRRTLGID